MASTLAYEPLMTDQNNARTDMSDVEKRHYETEEEFRYIGAFLAMWRKQEKLTQAQIGDLVDRSRVWVSQVERGENESLKSYMLYAKALDKPFSYFVAMAENAADKEHKLNS